MRKLADTDAGQVRENLLRVASLAGLMQVVPAHDISPYKGIPRLPAQSTTQGSWPHVPGRLCSAGED
jgi:hypothetical protein